MRLVAIFEVRRMRTQSLSVMRKWPFWSLLALALSLSVVLAIPDLRAIVFPSGAVGVVCAVVVAWIFVLSHAIGPTLQVVSKYGRSGSRH
jgi:peptidoglycan/LPS O-acetylase OafA/YrhL